MGMCVGMRHRYSLTLEVDREKCLNMYVKFHTKKLLVKVSESNIFVSLQSLSKTHYNYRKNIF